MKKPLKAYQSLTCSSSHILSFQGPLVIGRVGIGSRQPNQKMHVKQLNGNTMGTLQTHKA